MMTTSCDVFCEECCLQPSRSCFEQGVLVQPKARAPNESVAESSALHEACRVNAATVLCLQQSSEECDRVILEIDMGLFRQSRLHLASCCIEQELTPSIVCSVIMQAWRWQRLAFCLLQTHTHSAANCRAYRCLRMAQLERACLTKNLCSRLRTRELLCWELLIKLQHTMLGSSTSSLGRNDKSSSSARSCQLSLQISAARSCSAGSRLVLVLLTCGCLLAGHASE